MRIEIPAPANDNEDKSLKRWLVDATLRHEKANHTTVTPYSTTIFACTYDQAVGYAKRKMQQMGLIGEITFDRVLLAEG